MDALLKEQLGLWQEVQARSDELLPELLQRADWLEQLQLTGTEGRAPESLRVDAQAVLDHLKGGGNWGGFFGKPAAVRNRFYLRDSVKVAGQAADTPAALQALLDHLRLSQQLARLEEIWTAAGVTPGGPVKLRVLAA